MTDSELKKRMQDLGINTRQRTPQNLRKEVRHSLSYCLSHTPDDDFSGLDTESLKSWARRFASSLACVLLQAGWVSNAPPSLVAALVIDVFADLLKE